MRPGAGSVREVAAHARRVLRERALVIVIVAGTFGIVAATIEGRSVTTYTATARIEQHGFVVASDPLLVNLRPLVPEASPESIRARLIAAARSDAVARAADRLRGPGRPSVRGRVVTGASLDVLAVGVTSTDPEEAASGANAVAEVMTDHINERELARLDAIIEVVRRARDDAYEVERSYIQTAAANETLSRLSTLRRVARAARIVDRARAPQRATSIPGRRFFMALLVGASLGLIAAFVIDALTPRPLDPRRLALAAGLPIAALLAGVRRRRPQDIRAGLDRLRVALKDPSWIAEQPRVVLVTSPVPDDNRSRVALGLAEAAAAAGVDVCVVDGHLRHPALAARLQAGGEHDLIDVLEGRAPAESALVPIETPLGGRPLHLIAASAPADDPARLLHGSGVHELVETLRDRYELVVVDAPPVLGSADAAHLAKEADALLLVARAGATTLEQLGLAGEELGRIRSGASALVVVDVARSDLVHAGFAPPRAAYDQAVRRPEPVGGAV